MAELNLRKLFVEHTVSLQPDSVPDKGTVELVAATSESRVLFRKHPDDTVYVIDETGGHVLAVSKPRQVVLPLVVYPGSAIDVEAAIQERLQALLDAVISWKGDVSVVPVEQAVSGLVERLEGINAGGPQLHAIVASDVAQLRLPSSDWDQAPFYAWDGLRDDVLYGLAEPGRVGHIVTDRVTGAVGLLCVGGVVAVQLPPV
jgi:hypothetical protein